MNASAKQMNIGPAKGVLVGVLTLVFGYVIWSTYLVDPPPETPPSSTVNATVETNVVSTAAEKIPSLSYLQLEKISPEALMAYCPFSPDGSTQDETKLKDQVLGSEDASTPETLADDEEQKAIADGASDNIILETSRGKIAIVDGKLVRHGEHLNGAHQMVEIEGSNVFVRKAKPK